MTFDEFDIDPRCLKLLDSMEITTPSPIQAAAIPAALEGKDLIATAQTGTGKTLGFVLPALTLLAQERQRRNRMLILTPTRELCVQVEKVVDSFAKALRLRSVLVHGGVNMNAQTTRLRRGCDVIVATPGRLLDHMSRGNIRFHDLEIFVLDEADRMLDMGFLPDLKRIVAKLPQDRQTLMFSATFPDEIARLAQEMLRDPERIAVGAIAKPVESVRQLIYPVRQESKSAKLLEYLKEEEIDSGIIFLRTKMRTDRLGRTLKKAGYNCAVIHGDLSQQRRQRALKGFREGRYSLLVATDVAARGLDIDNVSHVINYDVPPTADDYVHRVGRTARASREGDAVTFVTPTEYNALAAIEGAVGTNIPRKEYSDAPPILSLVSANKKQTRRRGAVVRSGRTMFRRRR